MSDLERLRHQIRTAIATVSLTGISLAMACDRDGNQNGPEATKQTAEQAPEQAPDNNGASAPPSTAASDSSPKQATEKPEQNYPKRWGQDPYDPEGEEEEGCVNGDWCGSPELARKLAPQNDPEEIGCPTHLRGTVNHGLDPKDKRLEGLSLNSVMMGRLRKLASAEARETGPKDTCCYHWFDYCSGRPLLAYTQTPDDALTTLAGKLADTLPGDGWESPSRRPSSEQPTPVVGREWLADAQAEHASIAAFAGQMLDLVRTGAPANLLAATARAGRDEIRHARECFALAAHHLGESQCPGPLVHQPASDASLEDIACALFLEGCVGETIAALTAGRAAKQARCAGTRKVLQTIAEDEAQHAALAWQTLAYLFARGQEPVVEAVAQLAERLADELSSTTPEAPNTSGYEAFGRLGSTARVQARNAAWQQIITPQLQELVQAINCSRETEVIARA